MNQIERLLQKYRAERDKLNFLIDTLERERPEPGEKRSTSVRRGRKQSSSSIRALSEKALEAEQHRYKGLKMPALLAEIGKLGFKSTSDNPGNTVNSVLHRIPAFTKLDDGRWILTKHVARAEANDFSVSGNGQKTAA